MFEHPEVQLVRREDIGVEGAAAAAGLDDPEDAGATRDTKMQDSTAGEAAEIAAARLRELFGDVDAMVDDKGTGTGTGAGDGDSDAHMGSKGRAPQLQLQLQPQPQEQEQDEEQEFEFRLFHTAKPSKPDTQGAPPGERDDGDGDGVQKLRIRLRSPSPSGVPAPGEGGLVNSHRDWNYYFSDPAAIFDAYNAANVADKEASASSSAAPGKELAKAQFAEVAVSADNIVDYSKNLTPGCHLAWRVVHLKVGPAQLKQHQQDSASHCLPQPQPQPQPQSDLQAHASTSTAPAPLVTTPADVAKTPKSHNKPGKKRRIMVRKRQEAAKKAEEDDKEKRNRKNRERKVKRRQRNRLLKGDSATAGEQEQERGPDSDVDVNMG